MKPSKEILNIIQAKNEADKKFNETVRMRIIGLVNVGRSVLEKAGMSNHEFSNTEIKKYFPVETHWFFEWFDWRGQNIITCVDEKFIHCSRHGRDRMFNFKIDTNVLALSDRDFAKLIRKGAKSFRENKNSQEHFARIKHIADMKNAMEVMQESIRKEENIAKEYTLNQERLINESAERTRASHARRMARRQREREAVEAENSLAEIA